MAPFLVCTIVERVHKPPRAITQRMRCGSGSMAELGWCSRTIVAATERHRLWALRQLLCHPLSRRKSRTHLPPTARPGSRPETLVQTSAGVLINQDETWRRT